MPTPTPDRNDRPRPPRADRYAATLTALNRHGDALRATARRFARSPEDAEDAFQRSIEIALEKAPATDLDELVPWLRTVIKHEAFALTRTASRALPVSDEPGVLEKARLAPSAADEARTRERLALAADTLRRLKPQEARAIRLKAQGFTYDEISRLTGWTYTKVNRCLTEGRASFRNKIERIEGAEA